jgi:hypothetical protein
MSSITKQFSPQANFNGNYILIHPDAATYFFGLTDNDIKLALKTIPSSIKYSFDGTMFSTKSYRDLLTAFNRITNAPSILYDDGTNTATSNGIVKGTLFRDMGKKIYFSVNGQNAFIMTKVQLVYGSRSIGTGGIPEKNGQFYINTFDASNSVYDGGNNADRVAAEVCVARIS